MFKKLKDMFRKKKEYEDYLDLEIRPITAREAMEYANEKSKHNYTRDVDLCFSCYAVPELEPHDVLVGVLIAGRADNECDDAWRTLEVFFMSTDGSTYVYSRLFSACLQIAKFLGYKKVIACGTEEEINASVEESEVECSCENVINRQTWEIKF